jgi:DNA-directed RNA polymerase specialized sigma24 family protein
MDGHAEADAFVALLERHARHMLGVARMVTGDPVLAERAVCEAALAAWRLRDAEPGDPEAWLGRLARRHALALRRAA